MPTSTRKGRAVKADALSVLLRPLWRRVQSMVGRGLVTRVDEGEDLLKIQARLFAGELRDRVHVLGHYGFASSPEAGAEAVVVFLGGGRDNGVAVSVDDRRYRPTDLQPGEVRVYSRHGGTVSLMANGDVRIHAEGVVRVEGNTVVTGKVDASDTVTSAEDLLAGGDVRDGDAAAIAKTMRAMRATFNAHRHGETGGSGPTTPPLVPM